MNTVSVKCSERGAYSGEKRAHADGHSSDRMHLVRNSSAGTTKILSGLSPNGLPQSSHFLLPEGTSQVYYILVARQQLTEIKGNHFSTLSYF